MIYTDLSPEAVGMNDNRRSHDRCSLQNNLSNVEIPRGDAYIIQTTSLSIKAAQST